MEDKFREAFIKFCTTPQKYELGTYTFQQFVDHLILDLNSKSCIATYHSQENSICISHEENDEIEISLHFVENSKFEIRRTEIDIDDEIAKLTGTLIINTLNAYISWETEKLPLGIDYDLLEIDLSLTDVEITDEEKETIEGILQRIALKRNLYYNHIKEVSFELQLRGKYPHKAPRIPILDVDFDWL
jgi:hypothetical protein